MATKHKQEEFYKVILNADNEIMLSIFARSGEPEDSTILYDGGEHAMFYRDKETAVVLDYLPPETYEAWNNAETILIAEYKEDATEEEPVRAYDVPIRHMKRLPADMSDMLSFEELVENPDKLEEILKSSPKIKNMIIKVAEAAKKIEADKKAEEAKK
ncbi:MAG: hypothetical protein KAJ75_02690 [Alphaproteobacteria bacterium]|nr:hypothetical protein [Alphaproteobacteria bacterium]